MITSISNPKIKNIILLQKKGKVRREQSSFVVEGLKMVLEAPENRLKEIFISESFAGDKKNKALVLAKAEQAQIFVETVSDKVFRDISDTITPQGVMAVVSSKTWSWESLLQKSGHENKLILLLESLQDPGNLGTILRTGEGAGIDGVILNKNCVDAYMPKVIRSTMGSIYRVPIAVAEDLSEVVSQMKAMGMGVFAAHLKGEKNYCQQDFRKDTCFMIGNESNGLSENLAGMATDYIRIPMSGRVESLNAGIAAALLMYEARRQRDIQ